MLDPQQRLFMECCWEAFENAAYNPRTYNGSVGIFAGASQSTYYINYILPAQAHSDGIDHYEAFISNDKDFLSTRVAYKLNLKGPAITIQTACSTSLVAVYTACSSLLKGDCDMALAGGSTIRFPQKQGYIFQEGMILSPDGHCRTFDAQSQGCIGGNGVGVIILKRLEDALNDGDCIHTVIKGLRLIMMEHKKWGILLQEWRGKQQ